MANDLGGFNSEAWSSRMVDKLDQMNVALHLVNRKWEGDLSQNRTVWVRTPGSISMAPYTRGATISYSDLTPSKEAFTVNDGQYFAFEVDDIDRAQSDLSAMDVYMKRAVVAMNNVVESKILAAHAMTPGANVIAAAGPEVAATGTATLNDGAVAAINVATAGSGYGSTPPIVQVVGGGGVGARATAVLSGGGVASVGVTHGGSGYTAAPTVTFAGGGPIALDNSSSADTGIYPLFCRARALQSKNNVPGTFGTRWAVIDSNTTSLLLQDTDHFIRGGELGDQMVQTGLIGGVEVQRRASEAPGFIGMIAGYMVYETPHLPTSGATKFLLFGDNDAISYAAQITEIEVLRLQTTFANAIRGLLLHDTFVPDEASKRLVVLRALAS